MKRNLIIVLLIAILVLSTFLTGCNMARNGNLNNDINDIEDLSLIHISLALEPMVTLGSHNVVLTSNDLSLIHIYH